MTLMRNRFFQSIMALAIVYLAIVFFISQSPAGDSKAIADKLIEMSPDNRLDLLIQITGVNPLEGTAEARVLPWPQSDDIGYQFKSGWIPSQNISIHVDSVIGASNGGTSVYDFEKEVPTGGFNVQIDEQPGAGTRSKVSWYPLDLYNFEVPISVVGEESSLNILPQDYTKNIDTFDIKMTHGLWADPVKTVSMADEKSFDLAVDEFTNGQSSTVFTATRSNSTKLLVVIILLLMVTAMTSVGILTHMVVNGKRPPSLSSLTWTAALTYSLISLRGLMPGDPPIGIFVDKIFYFPSLILTLICSLWVLVTWVRRDDFQA
ncbi:MAG: DUF4436 domain-containing protein [Actinobacteria bacterium]|uniref:Unannotated protein n=1 Tax=freshwater metagenome TaxID=449393 RepID=A0A6J6JPQ8_9ZZZZ|nr:DUF4436 domain-containing protein [Actinomycetota bacterium]